MVFNSITFCIFFILFFLLYWKIAKGPLKITNIFILLCSYLFYGWWDWRFLGLILFSSLVDYWVAFQIEKANTQKKRKAFLLVSIISNIGLLSFFKYYNFFIDSLTLLLDNWSLQPDINTLSIVLPVGISFYTFQALSYTVDVYRKQLKACHDPIAFLTFVAFFPQLVAGPIERAKELLPQFYDKKQFSYPACIEGLRFILWGFFQKIVIADNLGVIVEKVYAHPEDYSGYCVLLATFCFTFQVYCDFAGYSNIAIGTARTLGFHLNQNFRAPFFATSLTDLWRRWHISLSQWFRDYVYIPLGGNKKTTFQSNCYLFITFVISGLWHGAAFTFILWGALHGLFLILSKRIPVKLPPYLARISVFLTFALLLMPFRANNMAHLNLLLERIFQFTGNLQSVINLLSSTFSYAKGISITVIIGGFMFMESKMQEQDFNQLIARIKKPFRISLYYLLLMLILVLGNFDVKPYFIYFQF